MRHTGVTGTDYDPYMIPCPSNGAEMIKEPPISDPYKFTNADRIRAMSDEELAEFLDRWELGDIDYSKTFCDLCEGQYDCHDDCLMDWLKGEVKDG